MGARMRITRAEAIAVRLPLHQPFIVSYGRFDDMPSVLLRIVTADGVEGWGEAVPDPHVTAESFEGAFASLCHVLLPCMEGLTVFNSELLHRRMGSARAEERRVGKERGVGGRTEDAEDK